MFASSMEMTQTTENQVIQMQEVFASSMEMTQTPKGQDIQMQAIEMIQTREV